MIAPHITTQPPTQSPIQSKSRRFSVSRPALLLLASLAFAIVGAAGEKEQPPTIAVFCS